MVSLPSALTPVQGSDHDLRVPESQKHKPHPGSCLWDLGAQTRLLCSALNSGLEDSTSKRRAKTLQSLSAKSCSSGWAPRGGTRVGDTERETHRGRSGQPQRPLCFMQMGTDVPKLVCLSSQTHHCCSQCHRQGLPHSQILLFPGGKKRCPIMMGFLVTVLSFLLPRAHLFMWRFDSLSPTKTKDNGKVVPVRALRGEHSSDTQA